jgi:transposase-like protein
MIDYPINELLNEEGCKQWLERHLHPNGFVCPQCQSQERRFHRQQRSFESYLCRACGCYYTLLTGSAFAGSRQSARTLVLLLRGISKGESTNRLHRELDMSYKQVLTLRHRLQQHLDESAPTAVMQGDEFEVDELYQNAGEKKHPPP